MLASTLLKRGALIAVVLLMALGVIVATPGGVQAAYTSCRGDPVVFLSNGAQVKMTALILTDAKNVEQVVYTVHAPRGTRVTGIIYTGGALAGKEVVKFYPDQGLNAYAVETIVHTGPNPATVSAATRIANASRTVTGYSGQVLAVSFDETIRGLAPSRINRVR